MGFDGMCVCVQYKTEKDGIQETRVEHKVVLASTDDDFDYDAVSMGINMVMVHVDHKLCKPLTANVAVMHSLQPLEPPQGADL